MSSKSDSKSIEVDKLDRILIESEDLRKTVGQVINRVAAENEVDADSLSFKDVKDDNELIGVIDIIIHAVKEIGELFRETGMIDIMTDKAGYTRVQKRDVFFVMRSIIKAMTEEERNELNNGGFAGKVMNLTLEVVETLVNQDKLLDFQYLEFLTETHVCVYVNKGF